MMILFSPMVKAESLDSKLKEIEDFNTPVVVLTADAIKGRREEYLKEAIEDI